ncbi:MAG: response regulator transcription factor [Bacteriovoracaceae bacterium]|nr:response regulator transcription factor [Bacteriovoracaceae bacterium]
MTNSNLLVIEDEISILYFFAEEAREVFSNVYMASNISMAKEILSSHKIHAILTDNHLPDGEAIDLLEKLSSNKTYIPSVVITAFANKNLLIRAVNTHIVQFLEKPSGIKTLKESLINLKKYTSQYHKHTKLVENYTLSKQTSFNLKNAYGISNRELEIISNALHPLENSSIASELGIARGTVRRHLENIFKKLEITSRTELRDFVKNLNRTTPQNSPFQCPQVI